MSRLKLAGLIVAAVALIAAASAGGYLLGEDQAADQSDVISAKHDASREAFALSNLESMTSSLERGIEQGLSDGQERAEYDGNAEGTVAGQRAASEEVGGVLASRRGGLPFRAIRRDRRLPLHNLPAARRSDRRRASVFLITHEDFVRRVDAPCFVVRQG